MNLAGDFPEAPSVVVPTKARAADVCRLITSLLGQSLLPREIIIVDQSATDEPRRAVEEAWANRSRDSQPELVYIHDPAIDGSAEARNEGLRRSKSPWVVFFDDDAVPVNDCLLLLGQAFAGHSELLALGGIISNYTAPPTWLRLFRRLFYRGPFWDERQHVYWNSASYSPGQIIPTGKLNGGCMAFRTQILTRIGGFDARYRGPSVGEDVEISQRLLRLTGSTKTLAMVGGALMSHLSSGAWKARNRRQEFEIIAAHYSYRKNLPHSTPNVLRFAWMCFGILLSASASSLRRWSLQPLTSPLAGIRCVRSGYDGCPFLQSEHSK